MTTFICWILPYFTLLIFIFGMVYRIYVWRKLPAPKMTLTPSPADDKARYIELFKETFFFKSLFKGDKVLWAMGWVFHAMLALIFIGHFRVIMWLPDKILAFFGMSYENINTMSSTAGGGAGIIILVALAFLLARRFFTPRVREISSNADFLALFLIIAIVLTGDAMRFISHFELEQTRIYFKGLLTFSAAPVPTNGWFLTHYLLGQLLIIYMPFSKIMHFGGIFFSEALIQKN